MLSVPIAHGEGNYFCDEKTLDELESEGRVIFRYCDEYGRATPESNPNGSLENIAGIANKGFTVLGMMPHPERACEKILGSIDGRVIPESVTKALMFA